MAVGGDDVAWMLKLSRTLELLGPEETSETILAFSNFSKDGCHNKDIFCGDPGDGSNRDVSADKTKTNLHDLVSTNLKL
ncbi:hypothetical protein OsI_37033 [Oryza sativa Indica Group]|uniref:Uncharacterized protein n=1 Tax=Oryza sativa subsp. indica TaxID=39946 RepID=A2ZGY4_ORYSI|nr:hypothetical protein OsI_37033 [Oryza sativa Indica Group]